MTPDLVVEIVQRGIQTALYLSAPVLLISISAGLLVSLLQAVTQINEPTLTFLPKLLAAALALFIFFPWMISLMVGFSSDLISHIPSYIR